ncbi:NAD-dependent epimerase/dehydratase family protein [Rhodococcus opacus]|nr:NAD-dependent epimerase/dehydratase family protein [Rhodococcus opacus]
MLVTVTGGTGFVGSHTVAQILRGGHRVRLLVRSEAAVDDALRPLGIDPGGVDVLVGDVLDEQSVARAVRGADAVLHAASVYSFDSRDRHRMREVNAGGTENVLGAARAAGARTLYVSSIVALMPSGRTPLHTGSPVGRSREPYFASKAAAERVARRHQAQGSPIVISYPPAMLGPHDPHFGDQTTRLRNVLRNLIPIWPLGGYAVGDVRDTAALHAAALTHATGSDRYFGPGVYLSTRQYMRTLRRVTGRGLPTVYLPAHAMYPVGLLADVVQRVWPYHIPAEYGALYTCGCATRIDQSVTAPQELTARPVEQTLADTVRWLYQSGKLSDHQAGAAATANRT